jgi:hypothetical protein
MLINNGYSPRLIRIYKTIILPVILYGCETWSLTLREEHRLRVFENRVLRRIFGPKRGEVTGEWRKLHNEKLRDLHSSPSVIRIIMSMRMRWAGHVARMGEKRNAYRLFVGKPEGKRPLGSVARMGEKRNAYRLLVGKLEGKRPLGRPRHRRVDYIWMDLEEVGWGGVDWIDLAKDRDRWSALVNSVSNLRVPYNARKLSSCLTTDGLLSSAQLHRVS